MSYGLPTCRPIRLAALACAWLRSVTASRCDAYDVQVYVRAHDVSYASDATSLQHGADIFTSGVAPLSGSGSTQEALRLRLRMVSVYQIGTESVIPAY